MKKTIETISIDEVCNILSISKATVRNWMHTGKISVVENDEGNLQFAKNEILRLKSQIDDGSIKLLQSRRNKGAVKGHFVATEYVSYKPYIDLAKQIISWVNSEPRLTSSNYDSTHLIRLVLLEVAFKFLRDRVVTHNNNNLKHAIQTLSENLSSLKLSPEVQQLLENVKNLEIPYIEGEDFLGLLYMALSQLGERKRKGSYYTPVHITDILAERALEQFIKNAEATDSIEIIDPCCGSGNFLIRLYLLLKKKNISARLSGFDIDPIATAIATINMFLIMGFPASEKVNRSLMLEAGKINFMIETIDTLDFTSDKSYDLIIGNPPWGYHFSKRELTELKQRYQAYSGSVESSCLFIEWAIANLRQNGVLGFVLPESILNVTSHMKIRELLLTNTRLDDIEQTSKRFSNVYSSVITLVATRSTNNKNTNNISNITQVRYLENPHYIINIATSCQENEIVQHMKQKPGNLYLAGNASFGLGIVTGNNKRHLHKTCPPLGEVILNGTAINKYQIIEEELFIEYAPTKYQQVAPESIYRAPEKLIYRFINKKLIFSYDNRQRLTLNSANIVIPELPGYDMKYVLAILNARATQFYYTCSFSSVKVLRKYIEDLPIPVCNDGKQTAIVSLVNHLLAENEKKQRDKIDNAAVVTEIFEEIDRHIMELFQLTQQQQALIKDKIKG
ncbi:TaqI-like C-terminal specificity domain-containing protein [Desulfuribacillus alkaliarsenatis]|uniref:site-specific DNA-methyltransferase (adenine-specific) n=1 Tax=Desulfuribacillus alkaliarsenatis TaxID=766136 RepID=A0A1E5FZ78_9FIRM|nr:TaqI-like C-terminal specificity domain-containing protein [Desulfuribacillus alkaliarsenatis]OEF95884.1 hypothetical protein BHF68_10850 [Desulfuribacillus alkaliarsenatis]